MPRRELVAVAALLVFGAVLRGSHHERMAVEHFDEGVYAANAFSPPPNYRYPAQQLYAPPLLPALIEWTLLFTGNLPAAPMLVNLVAGSLTIVLVWLLGRSWFGPLAGVTAAALCAFSDLHLAYSRTALTDPLLCLWLALALLCIGAGHRRLNRGWLIAGGIVTGLAWWTKYNGWLPLAIQISGVTAWLIFGGREARRRWRWHVGGLFLTALVAGAVVVPMFADLPNGYAEVAANHRGYLTGVAGWTESLRRQWEAHRHFDGTIAICGLAYAVLLGAALCVGRRGGRPAWVGFGGTDAPGGPIVRGWIVVLAAAVLLCGLAAWAGTSAVFAGLTVLILAVGFRRKPGYRSATVPRSGDRGQGSGVSLTTHHSLAFWLLAAWFVGLFVTTPLYRAYPRLTLPWVMSAWLGAGACIAWFLQRQVVRNQGSGVRGQGSDTDRSPRATNQLVVPFSVVALVAGGALLWRFADRFQPVRVVGWQDRRGYRLMADEILKRSEQTIREPLPGLSPVGNRTPEMVFYVYGEPALYYQLAAKSQSASPAFVVAPVQDLGVKPLKVDGRDTPLPTFLLTGPHAHRSKAFQKQWRQHQGRFRQIGSDIPYPASDLVLLNEFPAGAVESGKARVGLYVRLYRVR